jgi:hypothetical protein
VGFVVGGLTTLLTLPIFGRLRGLNETADIATPESTEANALPDAPVPDALEGR